jgi:DivIVA domain-containing protein
MKKKEPESTSLPPAASSAPRMTPEDIQSKEFRIARFRGYKERDVDEFLDKLTLAWGSVLEENRRLRGSHPETSSPPGPPPSGTAGPGTDEVLRRAREEADRIVREAQARAAAIGAAAGGGGDRQAVSAFLGKEREFLQSLATLVQGHAEGVKGMAREVFASRDASPRAAEAAPTGGDGIPARPEAASTPPEPPEPPIRVEEPEPAGVSNREAEGTASTGDRSLRELFWGEE